MEFRCKQRRSILRGKCAVQNLTDIGVVRYLSAPECFHHSFADRPVAGEVFRQMRHFAAVYAEFSGDASAERNVAGEVHCFSLNGRREQMTKEKPGGFLLSGLRMNSQFQCSEMEPAPGRSRILKKTLCPELAPPFQRLQKGGIGDRNMNHSAGGKTAKQFFLIPCERMGDPEKQGAFPAGQEIPNDSQPLFGRLFQRLFHEAAGKTQRVDQCSVMGGKFDCFRKMRSRRGKGKESLSCGKFIQINLIAFCKLQVDEIQPRRESDRADVFQMERRIFIEFQEKSFALKISSGISARSGRYSLLNTQYGAGSWKRSGFSS